MSCCCCSVFLVWWVFCFRFVSVSAMLLLIVLQVLLREEDDCGRDDKTILLSQYCFEEHPVIVFQALLSCSLPPSLSPSLFLCHQLKHLCFDWKPDQIFQLGLFLICFDFFTWETWYYQITGCSENEQTATFTLFSIR